MANFLKILAQTLFLMQFSISTNAFSTNTFNTNTKFGTQVVSSKLVQKLFSTTDKQTISSVGSNEPHAGPSFTVKAADLLISSLFKITPLFDMAVRQARSSMVDQGKQVGVDWEVNVGQLQEDMDQLVTLYDKLDNSKAIVYPDYYLKPFHAYAEGNLSWKAAMEVESAAYTVHAKIFVEKKEDLDAQGDFTLRDNFHKNMRKMFEIYQFNPTRILDIGCSTGLSTIKLHRSFPKASIIGADLSPFMLAVASHQLNTDPSLKEAQGLIQYLHSSGEYSPLGRGDVDLVTLCLVNHELPEAASREIFKNAYDLLPMGGALALMDMDPLSPFFKKFASNPFAFAAFKSTEPWIQEYVGMDLVAVLKEVGFSSVEVDPNSPRHRTVVAFKR